MFFKRQHKTPPYRTVLFVCTANITRSPSAECMFKSHADKSHHKWDIGSAGVRAINGIGPNTVIGFILNRRGLSVAKHRSRLVDRKLINRYHWIIVMEKKHQETLIDQFPDAAERIHVMREFGTFQPPDEIDMPDPTGKEVENYNELFSILDEEVPRLYNAINDQIVSLEMGQ